MWYVSGEWSGNGCWSGLKLVSGGHLVLQISPSPISLLMLRLVKMTSWHSALSRRQKSVLKIKAKISIAGAKRVPMVWAIAFIPRMGLRTVLAAISNKVGEQPQANIHLKKEAKSLTAGKVISKKLSKPLKRQPCWSRCWSLRPSSNRARAC